MTNNTPAPTDLVEAIIAVVRDQLCSTDYPVSDYEREFAGKIIAAIFSEAQIKHMADRFLTWQLPVNFNPDGGISFNPVANGGTAHEYRRQPVGTNLLDATQAVEMVRFMVDGFGATPQPDPRDAEIERLRDALAKAEADAARYHWLRDNSCPPHNFYISVPDEFHGICYSPQEVDAYIDEARAALAKSEGRGNG